jgi:predicted phage tail protein
MSARVGAIAAMPLTLQPLVEVRLYGYLGRQFGRTHRLAVASAAEAVRALMVLFPALRLAIRRDQHYQVLVGRGDRRRALGERHLELKLGSADIVRIVPVVEGAKRAGVLQTVIGIVLIAVGLYTGNMQLVQMGASLVIGGVVQMLSRQRTSNTGDKESTASYVLDGPVNVTEQGGPVPLIIGRVVTGSVVVSSGLHSDDVALRNTPVYPLPPLPYEQGRYPGLPPGGTPQDGYPGSDPFGHPGELLES